MSIDELDPVVHAPKRLAAMAILVNSDTTDFAFLKEHLGISDSDLSKQMSALESAGYLTVRKSGRGRGARTWYRATTTGAAAFQRHVAALRAIVEQAADSPPA